MFDGVHHVVSAASVKHRLSGISDKAFHPIGRDAPASAGPRVFGSETSAGDMEFYLRIFGFKFPKFVCENNVGRGPDGIKNRNFGIKIPGGGFTDKSAEGGHAGSACDADQVFSGRIESWQEFSGGWDNEHFVSGLDPIDDTGAHFAIPFDRDFEVAAVECGRAEGVSPFIFSLMRPINGDELAGFEVRLVVCRPLEADCFNVGQLHLGGFDGHFSDDFCHELSAGYAAGRFCGENAQCKGC